MLDNSVSMGNMTLGEHKVRVQMSFLFHFFAFGIVVSQQHKTIKNRQCGSFPAYSPLTISLSLDHKHAIGSMLRD